MLGELRKFLESAARTPERGDGSDPALRLCLFCELLPASRIPLHGFLHCLLGRRTKEAERIRETIRERLDVGRSGETKVCLRVWDGMGWDGMGWP